MLEVLALLIAVTLVATTHNILVRYVDKAADGWKMLYLVLSVAVSVSPIWLQPRALQDASVFGDAGTLMWGIALFAATLLGICLVKMPRPNHD